MNRTNIVPHQNTVFHQITQLIPDPLIDRLVAQHDADASVRTLTTKGLLHTLLLAQLSDARSLRDIEAMLESHDTHRYHAGLPRARRSTLADAAASRPIGVFTGLLLALIARATRGLRRELGHCVRLIDSTTLPLNRLSQDWSRFSADLCGAKAHIVYDPDAGYPLYLDVTAARINDITAAKVMPIEPGATYVFDLGYYDYGWWAQFTDAGCRLVTRLKKNTPLHLVKTLPLPANAANIIADRIGFLPERMAYSRRNPYRVAVREVTVRTDNGKVLRIVSSDLDAPADEIAALYKRRWAIELFFRWIKQMLKLRHFYGTSENAVRMQITVALIAFVLIRLAHATQRVVPDLTRFARLVGANILHRKPLDALMRHGTAPYPVPTQCKAQVTLQWI